MPGHKRGVALKVWASEGVSLVQGSKKWLVYRRWWRPSSYECFLPLNDSLTSVALGGKSIILSEGYCLSDQLNILAILLVGRMRPSEGRGDFEPAYYCRNFALMATGRSPNLSTLPCYVLSNLRERAKATL